MDTDRGDNNCEYCYWCYYHCTRYAVRHDDDGRKRVLCVGIYLIYCQYRLIK